MEPRAALADYDEAKDHYTLLDHQPEPACGPAGAERPSIRSRRSIQAARHRAGCRRRLRLQDLHLSRRNRLPVGLEEASGVPVKWTSRPHRVLPHRRPWPRPCHDGARSPSTPKPGSPAFKVDTIANLGAYMSLFSSSVPTYLYATLLSGQYNIPNIHCNVRTVYTNTAPVDAYRGAGRPEATYLVERIMETAAREMGVSSGRTAAHRTSSSEFPHQTPVIMNYDAGDYRRVARMPRCRPPTMPVSARKAEAAGRGKLRGIGLSCYIEACGIAPSAGGRFARRRCRPLGIGRGARQPGRHDRGPHRLAQPRPGPRDHLCPAGRRPLRRAARQCPDRPRRHRQGAVRHGHLRLALRRRRHVGHRPRRSTRSRPRPRRSPPTCWRPTRATSSSRTAGQGRRHRQAAPVARGLPCRLHRPQPAGRHGAGPEGGRLLRPVQLHLPRRLPMSARSKSIRPPARPRSSSSSPPTISARSSTR